MIWPCDSTIEPLACLGNSTWASAVTIPGYRKPVSSIRTNVSAIAGRNWLRSMRGDQDHVDQLDENERHNDAAGTVNDQVATENGRGAHGTISHASQRQRDQCDNDQRVEDHA